MLSSSSHWSSLSKTLRHPLGSFKEVATQTIHKDQAMNGGVFETDKSAIDDDSSDWEDLIENGMSSIDEKTFFQRIDSRPNLTSCQSLITMRLHQQDCATALANSASQSTPAMLQSYASSHQGPSLDVSPDSNEGTPLMIGGRPSRDMPQLAAQPIITTSTNVTPHQATLSPNTIKRNMLQRELTASLRRHVLWEREEKNHTATAVLKRTHTARNAANLKQNPEKVCMGVHDTDNYGGWNPYLLYEVRDYHSTGW